MKIGIITLTLVGNYGGILQNYGLQQVLLKMGHQPINIKTTFRISILHWCLCCAKTILFRLCGRKRIFVERIYGSRQKRMSFIAQHINETSKQYTKISQNNISGLNLEALVVGSDQVWRPCYNNYLADNMFLKFAKRSDIKRVSYAASFGSDKWEFSPEETKSCAKLIQLFDAVSVRETQGVQFCNDYLGVKATKVLDPTLLLDKSEYEKLCKSVALIKRPILVVYFLDITPEKNQLAEKIAREKGLSLYIITDEIQDSDDAVERWLAAFRDAQFVVTDSFHGAVFSMVFNKCFYTICNVDRGASRFISLLSDVGLEDRLLDINKITRWRN